MGGKGKGRGEVERRKGFGPPKNFGPQKTWWLRHAFQIWSGWNLAEMFSKLICTNRWSQLLTSHFQDGCHDVISRSKVLPPGEWTRSIYHTIISYCVAAWLAKNQSVHCTWEVLSKYIYRNLSSKAEDILVSTVISRHHHPTLLTTLSWTSK